MVRGTVAISTHNWVGQGMPLHAPSSGKVLLAFAPEPVRTSVLAVRLERYTEATVTDPDPEGEHEEVVQRGWATTVEEYEVGLSAAAAPARDAEGRVVAAVSASGPSFRFSAETIGRIAPAVIAAADGLSRRLGHFRR